MPALQTGLPNPLAFRALGRELKFLPRGGREDMCASSSVSSEVRGEASSGWCVAQSNFILDIPVTGLGLPLLCKRDSLSQAPWDSRLSSLEIFPSNSFFLLILALRPSARESWHTLFNRRKAHPKFSFSKICPALNILSLHPTVTSYVRLPAAECALLHPILPILRSTWLSSACCILPTLHSTWSQLYLSSVLPVHLPGALTGTHTDLRPGHEG